MNIETNNDSKPDIFDKLMQKGFLKKFEPFYTANKEILMYLFFGGCTTLVGIVFFAIPSQLMHLKNINILGLAVDLNTQISNVISWICAVTFAYITNRMWVFTDKAYGAKAVANECAAFFAGRFFTLIVENILLNILTVSAHLDEIAAKIAVSVVTIILNYIISKLFVFKKHD